MEGVEPNAKSRGKAAAKQRARAAYANRYVMCGAALDALKRCTNASDAAVMARYAAETGEELARRPKTHRAIAAQARVDNAAGRMADCAHIIAEIEACRKLAIQEGRLKPGTVTNEYGGEYDRRHRAWVDAKYNMKVQQS